MQLRIETKALEVVLTPVDPPLKLQRSIWAEAKPELVVTRMLVFVLVKEQPFTLKTLVLAIELSLIPVVLKFSKKQFSTISCAALT
ncbi:MAG: hypothetical protein JWO45_2135 [Spartobacteria bacterium]|nr:hypothetical protein [Spartobacteria bacterium]